MPTEYFRNFPLINYKGQVSVNIMRRVAINDKIKNYISSFYPHVMTDNDRIEFLSHDYYGDVNYDWLIYYANDMIDPYYDVPLNEFDFKEYIKSKYVSEVIARRKILYYENNYKNDDTIMSIQRYVTLDNDQKKYWKPLMGYSGITGYERSAEDFRAATNKIITVNFVEGIGDFVNNENIVALNDNTAVAEIAYVDTTDNICILRHIRGDFYKNSNYSVRGEISGVTRTVDVSSYEELHKPIKDEEDVYYSPVYAYNYEEDLNQRKKSIRLIDKQYAETMQSQLTGTLNGNT